MDKRFLRRQATNGLERLNGEVKRRTGVVGIFPNGDALVRLVGATLLQQNDEWAVRRARCMTLETMAASSDDPLVGSPAMVIRPTRPHRRKASRPASRYTRPGTRSISARRAPFAGEKRWLGQQALSGYFPLRCARIGL
jgi:hypothetical protein